MVSFVKYVVFLALPLVATVITSFLNISYFLNATFDQWFNSVPNEQIYDYIVVGAGSAGSTIAAKLTDAGERVLLLEAGGPPPPFASIPFATPLLQLSPYDWSYRTTPQRHSCKGLVNNAGVWPRGKVLGGSSRLNYMAYVKGHPEDYRGWFDDFDDWMKKSEFVPDPPRWSTDMADAVLKGISELSESKQYKGRLSDFMKTLSTIKNGERWSTDRLLTDERLKKGLEVVTHAHVEKIIFGSDNKAEGVEFSKWGRKFINRAKSGVIVSAGAVESPKLLMLSGIGPKYHLEELNIEVVNDLPVGKNLIDHLLVGFDLVTLNVTLAPSTTTILDLVAMLNYALFRNGPLSSVGLEVVGTLHSSLMNNLTKNPDIQLMALTAGVSQDNGEHLYKTVGFTKEVFDGYFAPDKYKNSISITTVLLHPKSIGELKLKSKNPKDDPLIDPNYLSEEEDVATLIHGIKFLEDLINTESMQKLGAELNKRKFPGCETHEFDTWNYWDCYVRHTALTVYHPAGTCGFGSVVDNNFRVYNTQNLYIVDASVMPALPSGNPNAAIMLLARKAADVIHKLITDKPTVASEQCHADNAARSVFLSTEL